METIDNEALITACKSGNLAALKNTLDNTLPDQIFDAAAAIIAAAGDGHLESVRYLAEICLARGLRVNIAAKGHSAMVQAASNGHLEVVQYLVEMERAQNPQIPNFTAHKHLAICVAAENRHVAVVKYLISTLSAP